MNPADEARRFEQQRLEKLDRLRTHACANPGAFFDLAHAAHLEGMRRGSVNTQRAYRNDWRNFVAACEQMSFVALSPSPVAVEALIELSAPLSSELLKRNAYVREAPRLNYATSTIPGRRLDSPTMPAQYLRNQEAQDGAMTQRSRLRSAADLGCCADDRCRALHLRS